jgi:glycosyltransferase involved in cell wall biosynthesis
VIVVLNACTDHSAAVVESFVGRLPVRAVTEARPGVSHARNAAVANARGDLIVWSDDDVRVRPDLIRIYEDAFRASPETAFFGGAIHLAFIGVPPAWLAATLPIFGGILAGLPLDGVADGAPVVRDALPLGANFAIRRSVQQRYSFDTRLGRIPARWLRSHEETKLLAQVLADGHVGRWLPSAAADHLVAPARQRAEYFRTFFIGDGILSGPFEGEGTTARHVARDTLRVLRTEIRYRIARISRPPEEWMHALRVAGEMRGRWIATYDRRSAEAFRRG